MWVCRCVWGEFHKCPWILVIKSVLQQVLRLLGSSDSICRMLCQAVMTS